MTRGKNASTSQGTTILTAEIPVVLARKLEKVLESQITHKKPK